MDFSQSANATSALGPMLGGLILLYAAAQVLAGAMIHVEQVGPGRRAIWHAIPVAAIALVAAFQGHTQIALCVLTGTSVAALSLVPGICQIVSPEPQSTPSTPASWRALIPATLVFWMIGFHVQIDWLDAIFLVIIGLGILWIWHEPGAWMPSSAPRPSPLRIIILFLAIGVAIIAAILAIRGALRLEDVYISYANQRGERPPFTSIIFAADIVAPVLMLPLLGQSAQLIERQRPVEAYSTHVGLVAINLCVLVPLCVLVGYFRPEIWPDAAAQAMPFPLATWRVDAVLLIILSLSLLPRAGLRRGAMRIEGVILVLVYAGYLISIAGIQMLERI